MFLKFSVFLVISSGILKFLAIFFTDFNLFGDEAQYWVWSQNLNLGYYSKPPLLAWLISVVVFIFGSGFWILKAIPIILYFFTSYLIFLITYKLYKNKYLAIITAFSFYLSPGVSVSSFLISTDVLLIFFWCLSLWFLLKLRENAHLSNFMILGVFLGLAFLSKYAAIYFYPCVIILIILDKKTKDIFLKNPLGLTLFLFSTLVVLLPNIIWNIQNDWITLNHTSENASLNRVGFNLFNGLEFILIQALMVGGVVFSCFFYSIKKIKNNFQTKFLICFSLPIFFVILVESILVRANANWAAVAIPPLLILIINHCYKHLKLSILINSSVNAFFGIIFFLLISSSSSLSIFDRINGISFFAKDLKIKIKNNDLLVVEDRLLYSSLRYEYRKSKIKMLTPYEPGKVFKSHFQMTDPLPKNFHKKFIYIGWTENLKYLEKKFKFTNLHSAKTLFKKNEINVYEIIF